MANEKRLIEIPCDGIVRIPIRCGHDTVGEHLIDLSSFPTVDAVEVVHGRWIFDPYAFSMMCYECSNCGEWHDTKSNYCPNCGAKMDGDGNV